MRLRYRYTGSDAGAVIGFVRHLSGAVDSSYPQRTEPLNGESLKTTAKGLPRNDKCCFAAAPLSWTGGRQMGRGGLEKQYMDEIYKEKDADKGNGDAKLLFFLLHALTQKLFAFLI